jgi:hypothetical protein
VFVCEADTYQLLPSAEYAKAELEAIAKNNPHASHQITAIYGLLSILTPTHEIPSFDTIHGVVPLEAIAQ